MIFDNMNEFKQLYASFNFYSNSDIQEFINWKFKHFKQLYKPKLSIQFENWRHLI